MSSKLLQLSLYVVTVIQLTSSQSTYNVTQQENDVNSAGRTDQVLSKLMSAESQNDQMLGQLMTAVSQLQATVSQLQTAVSQLQRDNEEIKAGVMKAGKKIK